MPKVLIKFTLSKLENNATAWRFIAWCNQCCIRNNIRKKLIHIRERRAWLATQLEMQSTKTKCRVRNYHCQDSFFLFVLKTSQTKPLWTSFASATAAFTYVCKACSLFPVSPGCPWILVWFSPAGSGSSYSVSVKPWPWCRHATTMANSLPFMKNFVSILCYEIMLAVTLKKVPSAA